MIPMSSKSTPRASASRTLTVLPIVTVYDEDAYLRALAVMATPCFGAYATGDSVCGSCLLASGCKQATDARLASIAADIDQIDAATRARAQAHQRVVADQDASIDELLGLTAAKTTNAAPPSIIEVQRDSVCETCGKQIPKGTKAWWVRARGMFHSNCVPTEGT